MGCLEGCQGEDGNWKEYEQEKYTRNIQPNFYCIMISCCAFGCSVLHQRGLDSWPNLQLQTHSTVQ